MTMLWNITSSYNISHVLCQSCFQLAFINFSDYLDVSITYILKVLDFSSNHNVAEAIVLDIYMISSWAFLTAPAYQGCDLCHSIIMSHNLSQTY